LTFGAEVWYNIRAGPEVSGAPKTGSAPFVDRKGIKGICYCRFLPDVTFRFPQNIHLILHEN
jgi:hypothetical protein